MTPFLWLLLALSLHLAPGAVAPSRAQGSRKDDVVFNSRGTPLAGATIRVCAMPASGQPCSPLALIYSDAALTQALANPTASDGLGNYSFYAAPGKYMLEISGPGITTRQIPNVILPSDPSAPTFSSISSTGGISAFSLTLSGNLTVNGSTSVVGTLASGALNLSNQAASPGTAASGTVNLYTKSADKRLYYMDDTGAEIGPIANTSGAQTNVPNTFTAAQNFDGDVHDKGPNPSYDVTRFGGYIGPNYNTGTTGNISSGSSTLTVASSLDFANNQGILILGAGAATNLSAPTNIVATAVGVTGSTTYTYCVVDEDYANGKTPCSSASSVSNAVATLGLQTATLSACNRSSGVVTCTTTLAHNFVNGSQIEILRGSTGDSSFEGAFTLASASGSTFTFNQYGVPDKSGSVTSGSARVAGRVQLLWDAPANPYGTLKHLIYRCSTTCALPANAANFSLVGVAVGMDSSFLDYGYGVTPTSVDNGDPSSTAPTSASNRWLSTTIASGGGTTTLTLAASASATVSGAKVVHDNTPVLNAACTAFPKITSASGGTLYVPTPSNPNWLFPIASTWNMSTACPVSTEFDFNARLYLTAPIIPSPASKLKGLPGANVNQVAPFYTFTAPGVVIGTSYPLVYFLPGTSHDLGVESIILLCNQNYQNCLYQDMDTSGGGVASIHFTDVFPSSIGKSTPYVLKGGFGYFWDRGGWSNGAIDFSSPPAALLTVNCGNGQSGLLLPAILYTEKTFNFGGMLMDSCGRSLAGSGGGSHSEFREMISESSYNPIFRASTATSSVFAFDFLNPTYADVLGGFATPLFDLTNSSTAGFRVIHPFCATSNQPVLQTSSSSTAYNGIDIITTTQGCSWLGTNSFYSRSGQYNVDTYSNLQLALTGSSGRAYYLMSASSPAQSAVISSGGSVPIGSHNYAVTASDYDGGETPISASVSATTTSGNQTVTVTLPSSFPIGASGVNVYRDGALVQANACFKPQFTTPGGTYVDTFSFTCGSSPPILNTAGQSTFSSNGVSSTKLRVGGEAFTASPRSEQNIFLPGALTSTWTASTWTIDKPVTITRLQVQAKTAPSACSTNAIVRLTDGSTPINLTLSAAANDSGTLSQNYSAGSSLTISVQTAASGCTTSPADANVTIQYRMQ